MTACFTCPQHQFTDGKCALCCRRVIASLIPLIRKQSELIAQADKTLGYVPYNPPEKEAFMVFLQELVEDPEKGRLS